MVVSVKGVSKLEVDAFHCEIQAGCHNAVSLKCVRQIPEILNFDYAFMLEVFRRCLLLA
jgi:hypothetical protein